MANITYLNKDKTAALGTGPRTWRDEDANEVKNVVNNFRAHLVDGKVPKSQLPDVAIKIGSADDFNSTGISDGYILYWDQTTGKFRVKAETGGAADVDLDGNQDVFLFNKNQVGGAITLLLGLNDQQPSFILSAPTDAAGTPFFRKITTVLESLPELEQFNVAYARGGIALSEIDFYQDGTVTEKGLELPIMRVNTDVINNLSGNLIIVPDIAGLQTVVRGNNRFVAYVREEGRSGLFDYVQEASFPGTPDYGISFPAQDGGYWVRRFDVTIDLRWFDFVGDGSVDEYTKLNLAFAVGKSVDLNGLTIKTGTPVNIPESGITIFDSKNVGGFVRDTNGMFFNINNKSNIVFENIKLTGETVGEYIVGGVDISNVSTNIKFINCTFTKISQCLNLKECDNITVRDSTFIETGYGVLQTAGIISDNVFVLNNFIKDYHRDFVECNSASVETANWVITGNTCEGGFGWPTNFQTEGRFVGLTNISNVVITNNIINKTIGDNAIHLEGWCNQVIISGNTFDNCVNNSAGQSPYITLHGLANDNLRLKLIVQNNFFKRTDNTLPEVNAYIGGTHSRISRSIISGNFIESEGNLNGFNFPANSFNDTMITDNKFIGCPIGIYGNNFRDAQLANNYFIDCDSPIEVSLITKSQILDNTFIGTTGTYDVSSETFASTLDNGPNYVHINGNYFSKGIVGRDANFSSVTNNFFPTGSLMEWGRGGSFSPRYGNYYSGNKYEDFKNSIDGSVTRYDNIPKTYPGIGPADASGIPITGGLYIETTTEFNVGDKIENIFSLSGSKVMGWLCTLGGLPGTALWAEYGGIVRLPTNKGVSNYTIDITYLQNYIRFTGGVGTITVPPDVFSGNNEVIGEVEGGEKTFVGGAGVTVRYPDGFKPIVVTNGKFKLKFESANDVLLTGDLIPAPLSYEITANFNLNDTPIEGFNLYNTALFDFVNSPDDSKVWFIKRTKSDGLNNAFDIAIERGGDNSIYTRTATSGVWTSWKNISGFELDANGNAVIDNTKKVGNGTANSDNWTQYGNGATIHNVPTGQQHLFYQNGAIIAGINGDGKLYLDGAGDGIILKSPDGTQYELTVPNGGGSVTITAV